MVMIDRLADRIGQQVCRLLSHQPSNEGYQWFVWIQSKLPADFFFILSLAFQLLFQWLKIETKNKIAPWLFGLHFLFFLILYFIFN